MGRPAHLGIAAQPRGTARPAVLSLPVPLALLFALTLGSQARAQAGTQGHAPAARENLAIVHATIHTMADSTPLVDGTIVIVGRRVFDVGPAGSVTIPPGARIIDASGKHVIPGLWDMHVHTAVPEGDALLPLYIANGVTGVRDMGGDHARIQEWREAIREGHIIGPRLVAAGPYVQGGRAVLPHLVVRTPDEAARAVDSLAVLGVDFVKVHGVVPREAFFALARAARTYHLPLGGHLALGVSVQEAADSGQRSLEHLEGFANPCSPSDSVRLAAAHPFHRTVLGDCSTSDQSPVYRHIAEAPTWVTPTLIALEMIASLPDATLPSDSLAHYQPASLRAILAQALGTPQDMPEDASVLGRELWLKRLAVVSGLAEAGVPILAGTDAPLRNSMPGFGLHAELEALVRAGMSPWRALRTATEEPARYFDTDSIGRVCSGCVADLLVLDGDPLDDIRNTRRIALIVADGRAYPAAARKELLEGVLRAAGSSR